MEGVMESQIFFFITSVTVIILGLMLTIIFYQVYKIIRTIRRILEKIELGSETIRQDVAELRSFMYKGNMISKVFSFFSGARRSRRNDDY